MDGSTALVKRQEYIHHFCKCIPDAVTAVPLVPEFDFWLERDMP